ncbi:BTAD domain-containing putative transcriptional regulator [Nonomuraea monospora]|uniref:BTAD domain-containing putative transcriptional regulator n=1 Tax=Nonomuraea monospora TaxID=568818 RepID=A0ABP5PDL5_9ACTN
MRFAILGPLDVRRGNRTIMVNAEKQRVILATLLLSANRVVLADDLMERLWEQRLPRYARASLQTHLARLRRTLEDGDDDVEVIRTSPGGYLIEVAPEQLDLLRFRGLTEQATHAERAGDAAGELGLLREALSLWRGTALAGIRSDVILRDEVPQLTEEWFRCLHRRFDLELLLGNHDEIVAELRSLVRRYPLRERLCGQLMIALFRCGQQVEALKAYASVSAVLRHDYGLDVGDELERLQHAVLTGDPELVSVNGYRKGNREAGGAASPWTTPRQLPVSAGDFVGRTELLKRADAALDPGQSDTMAIVTMTGPAGVGKTATAIQVAHQVQDRFPDGQLYVKLQGVGEHPRTSTEVLGELLEATGLSPGAIPEGHEQRAALFRSRLADRRVLLILDDAADIEQVRPLLPGTPGCAVVITSRRLLSALPGAVPVRLGNLSEQESLDLLEALVGSRRIRQEAQPAARIAAACGHLPLALRIVGARLAAQPLARVATFAQRLQDGHRRLDELRISGLDLRRSLERSYVALDPPARTAFRRLGLLSGAEITPWTVAALAGAGDEHLADRLIEHNLLEPVGLNTIHDPTYRLHPLSALYAADLAKQDDPISTGAALRRYTDSLLAYAERASRQLPRAIGQLPPDGAVVASVPLNDVARVDVRPWRWLAAERDHLKDMALHCCRQGWHERAARITEVISQLASHEDALEMLGLLCVRVRDSAWANGDQRTGWRAEHHRAMLLLRQGRVEAARKIIAKCVTAFQQLDAARELPYSTAVLAAVNVMQLRAKEGLALAEHAYQLARSASDPYAEALALGAVGDALLGLRRKSEARNTLVRVLRLARELGETRLEAVTLNRMGWSSLRVGDLRAAPRMAEEARGLTGIGDRYGKARPLALLGAVALEQGRHGEAIQLAEESRRTFARLGDACGEAEVACLQGEIHLSAGRPRDAVALLVPGMSRLDELGAYRVRDRATRVLAEADTVLGEQRQRKRDGRWTEGATVRSLNRDGRSGAA